MQTLRPLLFTLGLTACAPSVQGLVRDRHYEEAFAAAEEKGSTSSDYALVCEAAVTDANAAVHVRVVPDDELTTALGDATADMKDTRIVRIHATTTSAPFDAYVVVTLIDGEQPEPQLDTTLEALATKTGEIKRARADAAAIDARKRADASSGSSLEGIWLIANVFLVGTPALMKWAVTGDAWVKSTPPPPGYDSPTPLPLASMPRAARIYDAMHPSSNPYGTHVDTFAAWKNLGEGEASSSLRLRAAVVVETKERRRSCTAVTTFALPPGPTLDARIATLFGPEERRLSDLGKLTVVQR